MSAEDAANLMLKLLNEHGELRQDDAANQIHAAYGEEVIYWNNNGNVAIKPEVLKIFNKLTPGVVWLRSSRYWRPRQEGDEPGRMQPY